MVIQQEKNSFLLIICLNQVLQIIQ
uniref:Uncharacterized protein n=1 Tax=Rhizophora mucronata TaxID=61149 RepID=A0A2P2PNG6_RHIMU